MGRNHGGWRRVSAEHPCPACGRDHFCTVSEDGAVCRCTRTPSERESKGSDGTITWIHRLAGDTRSRQWDAPPSKPKPKLGTDALTELSKRMFHHSRADARRADVARLLGVSVDSLVKLRVGYGADRNGREYSSWPVRNGAGQIVGIVRRYDDGEKRTYPGGTNGLFFSVENFRECRGPLLVVEGGSDTAAGVTAGVRVAGRPSNTGGADWLSDLCRRGKFRPIVIGEWDESPDRRGIHADCKTDCTGCGRCFPGRFGAIHVARQLSCNWIMAPNGAKDFRAAFNQGMIAWPELIQAL